MTDGKREKPRHLGRGLQSLIRPIISDPKETDLNREMEETRLVRKARGHNDLSETMLCTLVYDEDVETAKGRFRCRSLR